MTAQRIILFLAAAEIGLVGLGYLVSPSFMLGVSGMSIDTVNEFHAFRAGYGGLFVAFGLLFLAGALSPRLERTALIATLTFMSGFAAGRMASLVVDGQPGTGFLAVLATEIALAAAAWWALRKTA